MPSRHVIRRVYLIASPLPSITMLFRVPKQVDGFALTDHDREAVGRKVLVSRTFISFAVMMIFPWLVWCGIFFVGANVVIHDFSGPGSRASSANFGLVLIASIIGAGLCFLVVLWIFNARFIEARRVAMRELGYPVCIKCGQNLTGLTDDPHADRCPECGALICNMPGSDADGANETRT